MVDPCSRAHVVFRFVVLLPTLCACASVCVCVCVCGPFPPTSPWLCEGAGGLTQAVDHEALMRTLPPFLPPAAGTATAGSVVTHPSPPHAVLAGDRQEARQGWPPGVQPLQRVCTACQHPLPLACPHLLNVPCQRCDAFVWTFPALHTPNTFGGFDGNLLYCRTIDTTSLLLSPPVREGPTKKRMFWRDSC